MKKKMLAFAALLVPAVTMADSSYTVPAAVTSSISELEGAATSYAAVILPYIAAVGLAFIGISVIYLLFKVFKRFVGGK